MSVFYEQINFDDLFLFYIDNRGKNRKEKREKRERYMYINARE